MQPLLLHIEPCRYIVPALHGMLGIHNNMTNDFFNVLHIKLEDVSENTRLLRDKELKKADSVLEAQSAFHTWAEQSGVDLASKQHVRGLLIEWLHNTDDFFSREDLKDMEAKQEQLATYITQLAKEKKVLEKNVQNVGELLKNVKQRLKKAEKGKYPKRLKSKIEAILKKYGIDKAAYHGGDMVGNDCIRFMQKAAEIFVEIQECLVEEGNRQGKSEQVMKALLDRCGALQSALTTFDSLFSLINLPNKDVTAETAVRIGEVLEKCVVYWLALKDDNKHITPKLHALMKHLMSQTKALGGIGDYNEQFVERHHQSGKRDHHWS